LFESFGDACLEIVYASPAPRRHGTLTDLLAWPDTDPPAAISRIGALPPAPRSTSPWSASISWSASRSRPPEPAPLDAADLVTFESKYGAAVHGGFVLQDGEEVYWRGEKRLAVVWRRVT
jgi:hypothetical protein